MKSSKTPPPQPSAEPLPTPPAKWLPRFLHNLFMASLFVVVAFTFLRFGARWSAWCELFSHFPVQYGAYLLLGAAYCFAIAAPRQALGLFIFAAINLSVLLPIVMPRALPPEGEQVIPIASVNVLIKNRDYRRTLQFVEGANPDVLVVSEVDDEWLTALDALNYPVSRKFPARSWLGLAIYSRFEIVAQETFPAGERDPIAAAWTLKVPGGELVVIGAHPPPPSLPPTLERKAMLAELGQFVAKYAREKPTVLIGDLNVTPWSPYFADLLRTANLQDARLGSASLKTWPAFAPPLWIPIDHCLVNQDVAVHRFWTAPEMGSDHYPIQCRVSVRGKSDSREGAGARNN